MYKRLTIYTALAGFNFPSDASFAFNLAAMAATVLVGPWVGVVSSQLAGAAGVEERSSGCMSHLLLLFFLGGPLGERREERGVRGVVRAN